MPRWQQSQKSQRHWQVSVGESSGRGIYIIYREKREERENHTTHCLYHVFCLAGNGSAR